MSQLTAVCWNKVQVELKAEIEFSHDKEFFCRNIIEEDCEEDCRDTLYSVAILSKANGSETLSRQS